MGETKPPSLQTQPTSVTQGTSLPSQKKSSLWNWILGGCLGCGCLFILLAITLFFIGGATFFKAGAGPWKAVSDYIEALKAKDYAQAYIYLSEEVQREITLLNFTSLIETRPGIYEGIEKARLNSVSVNNDRAKVEGVVIYVSGERAPLTADLVKEGNVWRILKITIHEKGE